MSDEADRPREGDRVRITTEGTVRAVGAYTVELEDRSYVNYTAEGRTVEILEWAMLKVGDVVMGSELTRLPEGSVVVGDSSGRAWQKRGDYWFSADAHHDRMSLPHGGSGVHRVLYVPEQ